MKNLEKIQLVTRIFWILFTARLRADFCRLMKHI